MPTVSTPNTKNPKQAPTPMRKADGRPYRYELISANGKTRYYSDNIADLIVGVLPPHENDELMLASRIRHARIVSSIQCGSAVRVAQLAGAKMSHEEKDILQGKKPVGEFWECEYPIALLSIDYFPFTKIPQPLSSEGDIPDPSNIIWLRPESDETYVKSLSVSGWIRLNRHKTFE